MTVGMFAKDKEIGRTIETVFRFGDEMILWSATVDDDRVETRLGEAKKTRLLVSRLTDAGQRFEVSTLASAIAERAEEADPTDFPCVVQLLKVPSSHGTEATVVQWVRDYGSPADRAKWAAKLAGDAEPEPASQGDLPDEF